MKNELIKLLENSDLIKPYDVLDISYVNARLKEVKSHKLHKQMTGGIVPCIKTNIQNYGVVVYEN